MKCVTLMRYVQLVRMPRLRNFNEIMSVSISYLGRISVVKYFTSLIIDPVQYITYVNKPGSSVLKRFTLIRINM